MTCPLPNGFAQSIGKTYVRVRTCENSRNSTKCLAKIAPEVRAAIASGSGPLYMKAIMIHDLLDLNRELNQHSDDNFLQDRMRVYEGAGKVVGHAMSANGGDTDSPAVAQSVKNYFAALGPEYRGDTDYWSEKAGDDSASPETTEAASAPAQEVTGRCPNWSPKFDQIDDPALVEPLRAQQQKGWDNVFQATGMTLQQQIDQGKQVVEQMQTAIKTDEQIYQQTEADNSPMPAVSSEDCKDVEGAAMVAACDKHHQDNGILGMEGMLDLMRCRAGMPMSAPVASSQANGSEAESGTTPAPSISAPVGSNPQDQIGIPANDNPNAPAACLQHLGESCYHPGQAGSLYFQGCILVRDPKNANACTCYNQAKGQYCQRMD